MLAISNAVQLLKHRWILKGFFRSWYSFGMIAYLLSFLLVSVFSVNKELSFFSSFSRTDGFFAFLFLSLFALYIYTIAAVSNNRKDILSLLQASVFGATILSLFILFSPEGFNILKWKWLADSGGGAMTGNQSVAGSYIIWNIFFSIILLVNSPSFKNKIVYGLSFIILFFSPLFFSWPVLFGGAQYDGVLSLIGLARGAFGGVVFGLIIALGTWLTLQKEKVRKYIGVGILVITLVSTIFGGVLLLDKSSSLHQKFVEATSQARFVFWDIAIEGFKENPVLGWGPNTFSYPFHKFFNPILFVTEGNSKVGSDIIVDKSHNLFFETLVSGGIVLLFALLFFIFSIIFSFVKSAKKEHISSLESALFVGAIFGWLLQAQFVFESLLSLAMLYVVCGIGYGTLIKEKDINLKNNIETIHTKEKVILVGICCVVLVLFIFTIFLPYYKNRQLYITYNTSLPRRALLWKELSGISTMGNHGDSILMFNKISDSYYQDIPNLGKLDERTREVFLEEVREVNKYIASLDEKDENYEFILLRIKLYYLEMRMTNDFSPLLVNETQNLFGKAISLSPRDPRVYWANAPIQIGIKNLAQAKEILEEALVIEPKIPLTHRLILLLAKSTNDKEYYNMALKRAETNIPGFSIN